MTVATPDIDLILASGSKTRSKMLADAGVNFRVVTADVDEDAIRRDLFDQDPDTTPTTVARILAAAKAEAVSHLHPAALVLGADQVLEAGRDLFTKPADLDAARNTLEALSGRTHRLLSAAVLAHGGKTVWQFLDIASLTMRDLSPAFLDHYIATCGSRILSSVGAYELEGMGAQLFDRIEGDYFTILGLPLLEVLDELRARGALLS